MAVPSYTTDLTLIHACDASSASWTEPTGFIDGAITVPDTDFFIQGTGCLSKTTGNAPTSFGAIYDFGSGVTIPADGAFLAWMIFACPNSLANQASGGMQLFCGSATTAFKQFYVRGADTYQYGGWVCVPVDPSLTADATTGSPTTTRRYFGGGASCPTTVPSRGAPYGLDVLRYGRCESRIANGSTADGYATFAGYAATNDNVSNRWGLIQATQGGYLMQGLTVLGYVTACDFRDSNKVMLIADTQKVTSAFNAIEVRQTGSRVDMTSIAFIALGTVSRGNWITTDNADINLDSCSFTDMGTFGFLAASTVIDCTFRRTDKITTGGATLTGCTIDSNRATTAVLASSPANAALVSGCSFISDGTGHGLEITGTAANMTLTNNTWVGYSGTSTDAAVFVNIASGSMNLTISGGTTPSVRTAGATVTVISGAVNVTATVTTDTGTAIETARVLVKTAAGGPFPFDATVTIVNSGTTATVTHTSHAMATNDKVVISGASLDANNGIFTITWISANSYSYTMGSTPGSSPTGTIKCSFVILSGTTNASGQITMSRVFSSAQPFTGWARKSSASPYYKQGAMSGTVSSSAGATPAAVLVSDE